MKVRKYRMNFFHGVQSVRVFASGVERLPCQRRPVLYQCCRWFKSTGAQGVLEEGRRVLWWYRYDEEMPFIQNLWSFSSHCLPLCCAVHHNALGAPFHWWTTCRLRWYNILQQQTILQHRCSTTYKGHLENTRVSAWWGNFPPPDPRKIARKVIFHNPFFQKKNKK